MKKRRLSSIRGKLFRLLMTVGLLFITACVGVYSMFAFRSESNARKNYSIQTAALLAAQMDQLTEKMDIIACQVMSSSELQALLHTAGRETSGNYFDSNLDARRSALRTLWLFNSPTKVVQAINVFEGRSYIGLLNAPSQERIDEVIQMDCWNVPDRGSYLIGPHMDDWLQVRDQPVISLVRAFSDTSTTFDRIGTIEVQVLLETVEEVLEIEDDSMSACILDDVGNVLYPAYLQGECIPFSEEPNGLYVFEDPEGTKCIGASAGMEKYDWQVLFYQPESTYRMAMFRAIILPLGTGLGMMALAIAAFLVISRSFTEPIRQLTTAVKSVTLDNADKLSALDASTEEVATLRDAFLERSRRLQDAANQLISASESELRLKLSVLQAHINPHFLYNSLMAISAAGQQGSSENVEDMCYQLAELYRYTDADQPQLVTLEDELDNARIYLAFMKYRYEDHLSFEINVTGDPASVQAPRLILQPLIENCFSHGFLSVAPPYILRINCHAGIDGWRIEVSDNGGGFGDEKLEALRLRLKEIDGVFESRSGYQSLSMDGMAIANVYIRLCSMYPGRICAFLGRDEALGGAEVSITASLKGGGTSDQNIAL